MTYAHTRRILLAAVAVLPLLVPPSALSSPPGLMATELSSAKVCGASECREVSDPEAASALAVGRRFRFTDAPVRGLPWYTSTYTFRAKERGEVFTGRVSVTVVPSAGLMRWEDGSWVPLPSESKKAYAKLTAGLTPRPARTLLEGWGATASPASTRSIAPPARPPRRRRATARTFGSSRWAAAC